MDKKTLVPPSTKRVIWNSFDTHWVLGLFGTAVGAGILFLPINAGVYGIFPVLIMVILVLPMTYLAHRGLARFVLSSKKINDNITEVLDDNFGQTSGYIINILYFLAIYPICLAYGVGITNTVNSFLVNQLHIIAIPRWLLAIILITAMMAVMVKGPHLMLKITAWIVYPLIISLFICSIYLIPSWQLSAFDFHNLPSLSTFALALLTTIPVLVFAFNHSPAISSFVVDVRTTYQVGLEEYKINSILFITSILLTIFIMFFVISCVLSLSPQQLLVAREQNIPILSYFANISTNNAFLLYVAPIVALTAIVSSFFGHYLGAFEGLNGIIYKQAKYLGKTPNTKYISYFSAWFIYISMIIVAILNPSILGFIEDLGGPIIAAILFLMPIYAIFKIPAMKKYSNIWVNCFIGIIGLITIFSLLYNLGKLF
ncbi:Serine transporter [Candidatus Hepatincola sp. Av]